MLKMINVWEAKFLVYIVNVTTWHSIDIMHITITKQWSTLAPVAHDTILLKVWKEGGDIGTVGAGKEVGICNPDGGAIADADVERTELEPMDAYES